MLFFYYLKVYIFMVRGVTTLVNNPINIFKRNSNNIIDNNNI